MNWISGATYYLSVIYGFLIIIGGALGCAINIMRKVSKKIDTVGGGLQSVLRNDIHGAYHTHMSSGYCDVSGKENIVKLHDYYKDLGGNGSVDRMVCEIMNLPTTQR